MANPNLTMVVKYNHRRGNALLQEMAGQAKRAPRRERGAILDRFAKRLVDECVRVVPKLELPEIPLYVVDPNDWSGMGGPDYVRLG